MSKWTSGIISIRAAKIAYKVTASDMKMKVSLAGQVENFGEMVCTFINTPKV